MKSARLWDLLLIFNLSNGDARIPDRTRISNFGSSEKTSKNSRKYARHQDAWPSSDGNLQPDPRNGKIGFNPHLSFLGAETELKNKKDHSNNDNGESMPLRDISLDISTSNTNGDDARAANSRTSDDYDDRQLSSQLTGCCYNYRGYSAEDMCSLYGQDCESGENPSQGDEDDETCEQEGLSFIGISFSVNTAYGNPYSYQLCDQFPMENLIDRNYEYVMSMDEDGWLVGGGYKSFDYSGKMPYMDSSHTEILRIGSLDVDKGGTTIEQVYEAMSSVSFPPFSIFPEYLKSGGGGGADDDGSVPSSDVTLIVSVVETYDDDGSYSTYATFIDNLLAAMYAVNGGSCMDDRDTDPHVSMARGVKFKSSYHQQQYLYNTNVEVAVWQAMYPRGTPIGSNKYASFSLNSGMGSKEVVGYGNLYFFFDRANITKAFHPNRDLTNSEAYYALLYTSTDTSYFYSNITTVTFDYSDSDDESDWEYDPYAWESSMMKHDMMDGWELPPNCEQEGETFFGIPLSRKSESNLIASNTFQTQFDFENIIDRNYSYIESFGTNHGWLVGEQIGNGAGSIVDKDTAHIPIFYTGTTNPDMGGIDLPDLIKVAKNIDFGTLYIKPAFVFIDGDGHIQLQFEMDPNSALGYLYDSLCKELGISWNGTSPYNKKGLYTSCAMHAAGDRAIYGCGPDGMGSGGFCPQMTVAYSARFHDEDHAAAYLAECNEYIDYWRSMYPSGVAVGTSSFCSEGGCLGLFLNRYDLYYVFNPGLGGSWVEYNGATFQPTFSPAPTWIGGCNNPRNAHLDRCFRKMANSRNVAQSWAALGFVWQFAVIIAIFTAIALVLSMSCTRTRKKRFIRKIYRIRRRTNKDLDSPMIERTNQNGKPLNRSRHSSRWKHSSSRPRSKSIERNISNSRSFNSRQKRTMPDRASGRGEQNMELKRGASESIRRKPSKLVPYLLDKDSQDLI